jgi:hypothetical protein
VRFQVTNVTDSPVTVTAGTNGDAGWLSYRVGDTVVADTARMHDGIIGPAPMERAVDPGASFTIEEMDPPVRWGGSLTIVPMCMNRALPPVRVTSIGAGAPATEAAVALANEAIAGRFDACLPPPGGSVTGSFPIEAARCESSVRSDDGFDVVTLVAVLPPSAPAVPMDELATTLAAVPMDVLTERDVHYGINWWVVVVTGGSASQVYHGAVSHCGGTFSAGGNGLAHCPGQG